jgi:hypothetical protein
MARDKTMTWLIVIACIVGYSFIAFVFTTCLIYADRKGKNPQDVYSEILDYWVVGFAWPITLPIVLGYHVFGFIFKKLSTIAITIIELILYAKDKNDDESDDKSDNTESIETNNNVQEYGKLVKIDGHLFREEQGEYTRIDRNLLAIPFVETEDFIINHLDAFKSDGYVVYCQEYDTYYMYRDGQWCALR